MNDSAPLKLSDLTARIQETIQDAFAGQLFWVVADVTNHSYRPKDQWHFFLLAEKEDNTNAIVAKAETVAWKSGATKIEQFEKVTGQPFKDGIHVLVKVSVDYSPLHGMKLTLQDIDPNYTIGVLERQRQAVLQRLLTECSDFIRQAGNKYITHNNQLRLNPVIQRIALVASESSAGYEDFMHILRTNAYGYHFDIDPYFTVIQGEGNAGAVRQRLLDVFQTGVSYDAVVLIRGGGASTDFLIFDTFSLGQIAAKFPIPIITGIGHQRNETIVDLMVHTMTNAPTKAAEFIIAHNRVFEEACLNARQSIVVRTQQLFAGHARRLAALQHQMGSLSLAYLQGHKSDLVNSQKNISIYQRNFLQNQRSQLAHWTSVFALLDPVNLLKKGFALVYYQGKIKVSGEDIPTGGQITVRLSDHVLDATVTNKTIVNGSEHQL